jgi:dihydrodipicolinate synthase/N-acetylneuraminate lyase
VLAALVTPTDDDGQLDEYALRELVDRLIAAGVAGLVPCGSTGEFAALSIAERRRITEVVAEAADRRVHVIPHTGAMRTADTLELSLHAQSVGASAVMVIPPYYEPPPFADVVALFVRISESVDLPIVYYNIPDASGLTVTAAQIGVLSDVARVRFVKNSSGDADLLQELIHTVPGIDVWNGWDTLTLFALLGGTKAVIWGVANVVPELCVELFNAAHYERDLSKARALWERLWPVCQFSQSGLSYSAVVKAGCALVGHPVGVPRSPVGDLREDQKHELARLLAGAGAAVSGGRLTVNASGQLR